MSSRENVHSILRKEKNIIKQCVYNKIRFISGEGELCMGICAYICVCVYI